MVGTVGWLAAYGFAGLATAWLFKRRRIVYGSIVTLPLATQGFLNTFTIVITYSYWKLRNRTVGQLIEERTRSHPKKVFCYFENEAWTYEMMNNLANKIANYFAAKGYRKGDIVGLVMENCPESICVWLGLCKIGVISSIVNVNLRHESLRETLKVGEPKATIFHANTAPAIQGALDLGGEFGQELYCFGASTVKKAVDLNKEFDSVSEANPKSKDTINYDDDLFWLYTSGSTGLPKAVPFRHSRYLITGFAVSKLWGINSNDMVYAYLPLYHGAGVGGSVNVTLYQGASMLLRKKFSASRFWKDCVEHNITVCQYIGEICRYLLRQPETPEEKQHKVKLFFGNGLRVEIWESFVKRFNIPKVGEFYGATEVNAGLFNIDNTIGAVGFIPHWLMWMVPAALIKVDEETMEPIRDPKTGLCIPCDIDEPGEFVVVTAGVYEIVNFQGYKNSDSNKKILRNVFKKGDAVFRSEDMLVIDQYGYVRFKDRAALNYRWKGENISAIEVENTISRLIGLKDAAAYGVKMPGADGYPGMVTIAAPETDVNQLLPQMKEKLPSYAVPIFVRLAKEIETTGTYKQMKKNFMQEGYDITKITDKIYFLLKGKYTLLDKSLYNDIMAGNVGA